ncbi:MAG: SAM hydroxide adenosyltransferase [Pseudonocardiaceae bacterium]
MAEGELVALVDSAGHLSVAQRAGSAARCTGLQAGAVVELITTLIDDPVT